MLALLLWLLDSLLLDQHLNCALKLGVSKIRKAHLTGAVNHVVVRIRVAVERLHSFAFPVLGNREVDAQLLHDLFHLCDIRIRVNPDQDQALVLVAPVQLLEVRDGRLAGASPLRPEVQNDHLAL